MFEEESEPWGPSLAAWPPELVQECRLAEHIFQGRTDQIPVVRGFISEALDDHALRHETELIACELATNAVLHSRSSGPTGCFTVGVYHTPKWTTSVITDSGATTIPTVVRRRSLYAEDGWGLHIVDALCHSWGHMVGPQGTAVWALLRAPEGPIHL